MLVHVCESVQCLTLNFHITCSCGLLLILSHLRPVISLFSNHDLSKLVINCLVSFIIYGLFYDYLWLLAGLLYHAVIAVIAEFTAAFSFSISVFLFLPYFSALSSFFYYYFGFFNFIITSLMQVPPNQILPNHAHPLFPQMARPTRPNAPPPPLLQPIKKALYPRQLHLLLPSGCQQQLALLRLPR